MKIFVINFTDYDGGYIHNNAFYDSEDEADKVCAELNKTRGKTTGRFEVDELEPGHSKFKVKENDVLLLKKEFIGEPNIDSLDSDRVQRVGEAGEDYFCVWASTKKLPLDLIQNNYGPDINKHSLTERLYETKALRKLDKENLSWID